MTAPVNVEVWANPGQPNETLLRDLGDYTLSPVVGEVGTISLSYPADGQDWDVLHDPIMAGGHVEVAIRTDGQATSEERALITTAKGDITKPGSVWEFTGLDLAHLLKAATLYPLPDATSTDVAFFGTAGKIMVELMGWAQTAGDIPGITWDFTATHDSNGVPWATQVSELTLAAGRDYINILQELDRELQLCEWEFTSGRVLRLFNHGTRGADRTIPPASQQVVLEWGRDLVDAPATATNTESATRVFAVGADGITATAVNASAEAVLGRQITAYRSYNNVGDPSVLQALAQAEAELIADGQHEYAHELTLAPGCPVPGRDFGVGDWVLRAVGGVTERLQVAQYTIRRSGGVVTATVSLGSLIDAHEVKTRRIIERLANGSSVVGASSPPPAVNDGKAPAKPLNLTGNSYTYKQGADTLVAVQLGWTDVLTNADGTPAGDVADYVVEYREKSVGDVYPWVQAALVTSNVATFGGVRPNVAIELRVMARDVWMNLSEWSDLYEMTTQADTTPPPQPSAPVLSLSLGQQVVALYDGKAFDGTAMPLDSTTWELHRSAAASFTDGPATLVNAHEWGTKRTVWTAGPGDLGKTWYFAVVAVDRDGNRSVKSVVAAATPTALGMADFPFDDNGNLAEDGSFEDPSGRVINAARSHPAWSFVEGTVSEPSDHGAWFARVDGANAPGTVRTLVLSPPVPVRAGQQFAQRCVLRRNTAGNGSLRMGVSWGMKDGSTSLSFLDFTAASVTAGTTWAQREIYYHVAPTNAATMQVFAEVRADVTAGRWELDRMELREAIGTQLIQNAAITNAKIVSLDVAKVTAGELTANILMSGEIRTGNAPDARVVINGDGIRKYAANNSVAVVEITETQTYIEGRIVTGRPGESRIEMGNASQGRDNLVAYDANGKAVLLIGQVYEQGSGTADRSGILIQDTGTNGANDDVFWAYGGGVNSIRRTVGANVQLLTMQGSVPGTNARDGGFLQLARNSVTDTIFGRRLANGSESYMWFNSSGTAIFNIADSQIAEINTNGLIATRLRGYGGAAAIQAAGGGDVQFGYDTLNGVKTPVLFSEASARFIKNFVIDHPDDPGRRYLVHGCTESPHAGVEYWGEVDVVGHHAVVELPAYFESLTRQDGRQVQVTVVLPDEREDFTVAPEPSGPAWHPSVEWPPPPPPTIPEIVPTVAASRPRDGRFRISCSAPTAKVAWLVKAIRADVPELVVEPRKDEVEVGGHGPYTWIAPRAA